MANFVPDIKTQRWVVVAPGRLARPDDIGKMGANVCPFCEGNESLTPPELYRDGTGEPNTKGWNIRVVPNKFPITDYHEVFVHSPDHIRDIEELPFEQVRKLIATYKERFVFHMNHGQVLIFCNHGQHAGASNPHPHSQLVVLPKQINLDALSREPITNIVSSGKLLTSYCPDFSQWPYEVWISPKTSGFTFGQITDEEVIELAQTLQWTIQQLKARHQTDPKLQSLGEDFNYNFYIYHGLDWYVRIIPRFIHRAGFELGTGLQVNIKDPVEAAKELASLPSTNEVVPVIPAVVPSAPINNTVVQVQEAVVNQPSDVPQINRGF